MPSFSREVRTIRLLLAGSRWALDNPVSMILDEYERLVDSGRLVNLERRSGLQIFFASRAIDSLLAYIVRWECNRLGGSPLRRGTIPNAIGLCINFIQRFGINAGNQFTRPTERGLDAVRQKRNRYLHQAGVFPSDSDLANFLNDTLASVREIITWR